MGGETKRGIVQSSGNIDGFMQQGLGFRAGKGVPGFITKQTFCGLLDRVNV